MAQPNGYSRLQIGLHWVIAVLLVIGWLTENGIENAWEAVERGQSFTNLGADLHIYAGFGVIILVAVRLWLRLMRGVPETRGGEHTIVAMAARYMYGALYALMLLVPLSGMAVWYLNFGALSGVHELLFAGLWVLVLLHTLAALFHHYFLKDGLIRRMMKAG